LKWRIYAGVFERSIAPCCGAHAASTTYAVCYVALWSLVAMAMYRYRLFVGV
jgi:hypothetical protein